MGTLHFSRLPVAWAPGACIALATSAAFAAAPPITAAAFAPDGQAVLLGSQAGLEVRSWPDLKLAGKLDTELAHIHDLAFSPNRSVLAAAGGWPAEEGMVELFSWPGGQQLGSYSPNSDLIYGIAWSPDGTEWATASAERSCLLFRADSGKARQTFRGHSRPVLAICFLPDGKTIVSAGVDETLRVWDATTGLPLRTLDNHVASVHDLAVRPTSIGGTLAVVASAGGDRTVRIWQPTIGRMVRFARLPSPPLAVDWAANGRLLVASCVDGHLRVIDPEAVRVLHDLPAIKGWAHTLAVAPTGDQILVAGQEGQVKRIVLPPISHR